MHVVQPVDVSLIPAVAKVVAGRLLPPRNAIKAKPMHRILYFLLLTVAITKISWPVDLGAVTSFHMSPVWTIADSDSSKFLFGTIEDVAIATDETVYVLDNQLDEIKVFSRNGAYLRTIGQHGDGPGDLRAAAVLFLLPNERVGIVSKMGGRVVILDIATGNEIGRWNPAGLNSTVVMLSKTVATHRGERSRIVSVLGEPGGGGFSQILSLVTYDLDNAVDWSPPAAVIAEVGRHGTDGFEEEYYYLLWNPWTIDKSDRIVMAPYWAQYELWYLDVQGNHLAEVRRPTLTRDRTDIEKRRLLDYAWGGTDPEPIIGVKLRLAAHEAAVREIWPRPGGGIWVRTCDAGSGRDRGVFLVLDEFDADGEYLGAVEIEGPGDESVDRVYFGPDGFMIVVHDAEGFIHNNRGHKRTAESYDLVVAAYRLVENP